MSTLVANPKDRLSHDEAQLVFVLYYLFSLCTLTYQGYFFNKSPLDEPVPILVPDKARNTTNHFKQRKSN